MNSHRKTLLVVDGVVNLALGVVLILFPAGMMEWLGLPTTHSYFYTTILGAVIFGIGVALFVELYGAGKGVRGLGLGGAIAINLCGGGALLVWLLAVPTEATTRGQVILWVVAVLVLGIGLAEIVTKSWKEGNHPTPGEQGHVGE